MPHLLLFFFVPLLLLFAAHLLFRRQNRRPLPRGSLGWPLIGETLEFISAANSPSPESFMNRRRLLYGNVFKSHVFGRATIISTDADVNRFVLQSDERAFVPCYPKSLSELMGRSSILLINGGLQRRIHGLVGAFLKSPQLKSRITADMSALLSQLMATWPDRRVLLQDQAKHIVFEILVKGIIGLEPGDQMKVLMRDFQEFIAGFISLPLNLPGTQLYKSLQAKKRMAVLVKKIIEDKRELRSPMTNNAKDAVDVLINDSSGKLTDDLISDNVIDLMIPAEDSVPVLITLAVNYLSHCPTALKQLEEENMELEERKFRQGLNLLWNDYMSLSFTQDVITETLRLGNIIGGIMRRAVRDVEVKGHFIPKGWSVFAYFRSVHLDQAIYEEPFSFNPWRWKGKEMSTCNFTPFGGGQRLCPGIDLARLQASIFLHHFVTSFTWVAEEDHVVNFPTVRLKQGMPVRLTRKEGACERNRLARVDH